MQKEIKFNWSDRNTARKDTLVNVAATHEWERNGLCEAKSNTVAIFYGDFERVNSRPFASFKKVIVVIT